MLGMHASSIWSHLGALNRHQYIILVMNKEGKFLKQLSQQKIWCSPVRKTICEYLITRHYSRIFWHFPKRKSEVFPLFSSRQIEACVPLSSSFPSQLTLVLSRCGRQFCGYQESWQCKLATVKRVQSRISKDNSSTERMRIINSIDKNELSKSWGKID